MLIVSSTDQAAHVWASILVGSPGFAHTVDQKTVRIQATPALGDPIGTTLTESAQYLLTRLELGILVIDLETRTRMRLNGWAQVEHDGALLVHVREVYFQLPQVHSGAPSRGKCLRSKKQR
jgi:hypothetical protein